jgi:hypothetical protein
MPLCSNVRERMLKTPACVAPTSFGSSTHHLGKCLFYRRWVGEMAYASDVKHWALMNSRPSANVTFMSLRVADLTAA